MIQEAFKLLIERKDFFMGLLLEHLQLSLISIMIATIIGLSLGIVISRYQKMAPFVLGTTNIIYTIPSISMLGFLLPLFGIGNKTAIIALIVYALLPIVRNTYVGLNSCDPDIIEAAKGMGSSPLQIFYKIKFPLALPIIISGFRNMVVMTITLTGIASFIGAGGLGVAIYRGITTNNPAMVLVGSFLIALLALVFDALFGYMEKQIKTKNRKRQIRVLIFIIITSALLIASVLMPDNKTKITIATKPMTEQLILGEMLKQVIEDSTDLEVNIVKGVGGGTSNIHPAMVAKEFDIYPEYTGTSWSAVLKMTTFTSNEEMFTIIQEQYAALYGLEYVSMYGFNNTYGIAVNRDVAQKYGLETFSDLAKVSSQLTLGAEYDFYEREDGFKALSQAYNLKFKRVVDMDIGLKYEALKRGEVDALIVFTTDGQLAASDVVILKDDLSFFQTYLAGSVARIELLNQYPELKTALMKLEGLISNEQMSYMNYQVETLKMSEKEVARQFLVENGVIKDE